MIQYQILLPSIIMTVWQTVRRITNEILGLKGLSEERDAGENAELPLCVIASRLSLLAPLDTRFSSREKMSV